MRGPARACREQGGRHPQHAVATSSGMHGSVQRVALPQSASVQDQAQARNKGMHTPGLAGAAGLDDLLAPDHRGGRRHERRERRRPDPKEPAELPERRCRQDHAGVGGGLAGMSGQGGVIVIAVFVVDEVDVAEHEHRGQHGVHLNDRKQGTALDCTHQ